MAHIPAVGIFTLKGHVPSKKNSKRIVCRGKFPQVLPSQAYTDWHKEQLPPLRNCWPWPPMPKATAVITIFSKDRRASDLTNKAESIMDILVDAGVIEDDNWNVITGVSVEYGGLDKENPRAEVRINRLA